MSAIKHWPIAFCEDHVKCYPLVIIELCNFAPNFLVLVHLFQPIRFFCRINAVSFIWLGGKSNLIECIHGRSVNKWCTHWTLSTEWKTISKSHKSIYLMAKCTWSSVFSSLQWTPYTYAKYGHVIRLFCMYIKSTRLIHQQFHFKSILAFFNYSAANRKIFSPRFLTLNHFVWHFRTDVSSCEIATMRWIWIHFFNLRIFFLQKKISMFSFQLRRLYEIIRC